MHKKLPVMRRARPPRRFQALKCAGALVLCEPLDEHAAGEVSEVSARPREELGRSSWRDRDLDS
jgi:hypothetical protein